MQTLYVHAMSKSTKPSKSLTADSRWAIENCAVWNARLAARRVSQFLARRMEAAGLSVAQFGLMTQVAASADDSLGALAERAGLDPSTLSRNLQVLERDGLVEIATGERDTRRRAVWLTELGRARLEAALVVWRAAHAELADRIDVEAVLRAAKATEGLERD